MASYIISPVSGINTGKAPDNGNAVRVDLFFSPTLGEIELSLTELLTVGAFKTLQCVFIDNSQNAGSLVIELPGVRQRLVVNGFSQSLEPLYVNDTTAYTLIKVKSVTANVTNAPVTLWFSNVPQPFYLKEDLINSNFMISQTLLMGNLTGAHHYTYTVDLRTSMSVYGVYDWPSIFVNNSAGFQTVRVTDVTTAEVIGLVNPYSVAMLETRGLGSGVYLFELLDQCMQATQTGFNYGYDLGVQFLSAKRVPYQYRSMPKDATLLQLNYATAAAAFTTYNVMVNSARRSICFTAPNIFYVWLLGIYFTPVVDASGNYAIYFDNQQYSSISAQPAGSFSYQNGATVQNITVREKF